MRGLTQEEEAALREIAASHNIIASRGPHAGQGSASGLIEHILSGDLATVMYDAEHEAGYLAELRQHAETASGFYGEFVLGIIEQLEDAAKRQWQSADMLGEEDAAENDAV